MKKFLALTLVLLLTFVFVACQPKVEDNGTDTPPPANTFDVVMVTDLGSIDDGSFNQGTWEGVKKYCEENNVTHTYLRPVEQTTDGYLTSIGQAVTSGAKIVICPGFLFETAIFQAQDLYPEVKFVLIDGYPQAGDYTTYETKANTYAVQFAEQDTGFLAGYAVVKEGFRKLAFFGGMAVPAVVRFGYGFVEGAEYASKELGLAAGEVEIKYWYSTTFDPSPEKLTTVTGWYETGTEIIFSCGGTILENVITAAEGMEDKYIVGVDVDQAHLSDRIITSSAKYLAKVAYDQLDLFFSDKFVGGVNDRLGVAQDGCGLPDDFSRFKNFTKADYDAIYAKLKANTDNIESDIATDATAADPTEIPLELVKLDYIG